MSASLAVQKAIRARLAQSSAVLALFPSLGIIDRNARPSPVPSIILGEDQEIEEGDIARRNILVNSTLHIWQKETGLVGAKAIAGAIRSAIVSRRLEGVDGFHFADCRLVSSRFIRDPDGEHSHGIVTFETLVHEVRP